MVDSAVCIIIFKATRVGLRDQYSIRMKPMYTGILASTSKLKCYIIHIQHYRGGVEGCYRGARVVYSPYTPRRHGVYIYVTENEKIARLAFSNLDT